VPPDVRVRENTTAGIATITASMMDKPASSECMKASTMAVVSAQNVRKPRIPPEGTNNSSESRAMPRTRARMAHINSVMRGPVRRSA
jgi:hypothetical protein